MISSKAKIESPVKILDELLTTSKTSRKKQRVNALHALMWMCLLLACLGTAWFSYQYFFVPQPKNYTPDWHGAQWVRATDSSSPVAYFRYVSQLDVLPDAAFVTIAADQTFLLFVNGSYVGSNSVDFVQGDTPRAYMYDVDSVLQPGANVIAIRVMNVNIQTPVLRATFGVLWGRTITYHGTGDSGWQATGQSALAHPRYTPKAQNWSTPLFDASSWPPVQKEANSGSPMLTVDPLTYEQPLPTRWLNAGAGHDSYFTRQFSLPAGFTEVLLRLAATGIVDIFINGRLLAVWQGQVALPQENVVSYLSDGSPVVEYRAGLAMGVYDISPYLHAGKNTIAVHVSSPGLSASKVGLATFGSAMSLDVLARWADRYDTVVTSDVGWHASPHSVEGWTQASNPSLAWSPATLLGRPGESRTFYLPDSNTPRNAQVVSPVLVTETIFLSVIAMFGLWLLMSLVVVRRYYLSRTEACEAMSLAFLPALALEALLLTLSREPQVPDPFPYTWQWGLALIVLVGVSYFLLWFHARRTFLRRDVMVTNHFNKPTVVYSETGLPTSSNGQYARLHLMERVRPWLAKHWLLIPIVLVAIPMISYNLGYEPYWQDELSSYYAAKGILVHGIPIYISGFLYAKGEVYSYLLALSMTIFGDQNGMPRLVSMLEYLISLPLFYGVGCYFFDRRIALLSTAMLAFSPYALLWGRQTRMYEQAFLMTLIVIYALYYALQHYQRARPVYLAVACIVIAYLSHEETFIILPAIIICALIFSPKGKYGVPLVLSQKHWWYALLIGTALIGLQLLIVFVTHPPHLGTDQSRRPQIQPTFDNIPFYLGLFFNSRTLREGIAPWIVVQPLFTVSSVLAILGCIWALRQPSNKARYCALMLILSLLTLVFIFTMQADRYVYPLFSLYYLMSSYAVLRILRAAWAFAHPYLGSRRPAYSTVPRSVNALSIPARIMVVGTASLLCASVLVLPMLPMSNYNLFFSRVTDLSYHRHFPDYDGAGQYVQHHWQKGDIIATIAPDLSTYYYFNGHAEYFFSIDRSLYLFERDGQIIDTALGERALLNQADFQALLATHARIWLISDNGNYQAGATKEGRFIFPPPDFQLVYEGYGSAVYFRGNY